MISCPICDETSVAVVSSISAAIFTSLLFFIGGFLSGYFALRFRYKHVIKSTVSTSEQPAHDRPNGQTQDHPLYEAIPGVEPRSLKLEDNAAYQEDLQMGENLAYIPVQSQSDEHQKLELRANIAYESVHTN